METRQCSFLVYFLLSCDVDDKRRGTKSFFVFFVCVFFCFVLWSKKIRRRREGIFSRVPMRDVGPSGHLRWLAVTQEKKSKLQGALTKHETAATFPSLSALAVCPCMCVCFVCVCVC